MKKILFLIILIALSFQSFSQNVRILHGQIIDAETKEPLPYANIVYHPKSIGTISNIEGYFNLNLYNSQNSDSVSITFIGYKPFNSTISEITSNDIIKLIPISTQLDEVAVTPEKFKINQFMKEVIVNYNINRLSTPHIAIAHYREKAKENGKFIMYMESLGYSIYTGTNEESTPLSNYNFFCENTKRFVHNKNWLQYKPTYANVVSPGANNLTNYFRRQEIWGLLSEKHSKKYKYTIDSTYYRNNSLIYCINFQRKDVKGVFHIREDNKQIISLKCSEFGMWSSPIRNVVRANVNIEFNYFENIPFVSKIQANYNIKGLEHSILLNVLAQKFIEFELNFDEYWSFQSYANNPYISYIPEIWSNHNIKNDLELNQIEKDLTNGEYSLEEYFIENSDRWHSPASEKREKAIEIVKTLKQNF